MTATKSVQKVAIVTGGSSGIGKAICTVLAASGFAVAVVGRNRIRTMETVRLLEKVTGHARRSAPIGLVLDVVNEADMRAMAARVMECYGRIDLLVASAGLGKKTDSQRLIPYPTQLLPLDEWNEVIGVNLTGVFLSNQAVLPVMRQQGWGHIINVCSCTTPYGLFGTPYAPAYCASKFGVVGLTETIAAEMAPFGIRVQVLLPGPVVTPLVDQTRLSSPFGGSMEPQSFANAVLYYVQHPADGVILNPHIVPFKPRMPSQTVRKRKLAPGIIGQVGEPT